jgi:hypothetical protein
MKVLYGAFLSIIFLCTSSQAPVSAHDWYLDLKAADGASCCSKKDCRPVDHRRTDGKGLEIEIGGVWIVIAAALVQPTSSPDNRAHACWYYGSIRNLDDKSRDYLNWNTTGPFIRCVILPAES